MGSADLMLMQMEPATTRRAAKPARSSSRSSAAPASRGSCWRSAGARRRSPQTHRARRHGRRGMETMLRRLIGPEIEFDVRRPPDPVNVIADPGADRAGGPEPGRQRAGRDGRWRAADRQGRRGRSGRSGRRRPRRGPRRTLRAAERQRHGHRHRRGDAGAALRAVLHDQGSRARAQGSASPSSTASPGRAAATSTSRASPATAPRSPSTCRWRAFLERRRVAGLSTASADRSCA